MATQKLNKWFRSQAKIIFIVVCVIIMFVWYAPRGCEVSGQKTRGEMFGRKIPLSKLENLARAWLAINRERYGENASNSLLNNLAFANAYNTLLLAHEAERYGVDITQADVKRELATFFPGQTPGDINGAAYGAWLGRNYLAGKDFEDALLTMKTAIKVRGIKYDSIVMTDDEAWDWFSRDRQQAKAAYVKIGAQELAPFTEVTDDALKTFYREHADTSAVESPDGFGYLQPDRVKIEYITLPWAQFMDQAKVSDEDISKYYEKNKARYEIAKAADAPADAPAQYKPLANVTAEIKKELQLAAAKKMAKDKMSEVNQAIGKLLERPFGSSETATIDLADIAAKYGLDYKSTGFFSKKEAPEILPGAADLEARAFGQGVHGIRRPTTILEAKDCYYIFQILEDKPSAPEPFDNIKADIEKDYRLSRGFAAAQVIVERAAQAKDMTQAEQNAREEIAKMLAKATSPAAKDAKAEAMVFSGESPFFSRLEYLSGFGPKFTQTAFDLKTDEIGFAVDPASKTAFVLQRNGVKVPARADFDARKDVYMEVYRYRKVSAEMQAWEADIIRRAKPSQEVMQALHFVQE